MFLGYLFPNKEIYTLKGEFKGKFKIWDDEKILTKYNNIDVHQIKYRLDAFGRENEFLDEGPGKLIKTNKRLIYKRVINPNSRSRSQRSFMSFYYIHEAKKLKKKGIKEYFELNIDEIIGYVETKFPWYSLKLYIFSNDLFNNKLQNYYFIDFKKKYTILKDDKILTKELSKEDIKKMKREEKEYLKSN